MPNNQVEAYICGKRFLFKTQDSAEYIQKLARMIDEKFRQMFETDSKITLFDASVLVAMEVLDQSVRSVKNNDSIRAQIKAYAEEANKLRTEVSRLKKELEQEKVTSEKFRAEAGILQLRSELDKNSKEQEAEPKQECLL